MTRSQRIDAIKTREVLAYFVDTLVGPRAEWILCPLDRHKLMAAGLAPRLVSLTRDELLSFWHSGAETQKLPTCDMCGRVLVREEV